MNLHLASPELRVFPRRVACHCLKAESVWVDDAASLILMSGRKRTHKWSRTGLREKRVQILICKDREVDPGKVL